MWSGKKFGDLASVAIVLFHAHGQRLYATQDQPALEGRENRPSSLLQKGQLFGLLRLGADDHTTKTVTVPVQELRSGVHHHVGAEFNRALEVGRHERVVDDDLNTMPVAEVADGAEITQFHQRIGGRLQKNDPRVLLDGTLHVGGVGSINVAKRHSEISEDLVKEARRPTVQIVPRDDVVARLEHGDDRH